MDLNGINLISYNNYGSTADFVLECSFDEAMSINGDELIVMSDGNKIAVFGGYHLTALEITPKGYTRAAFEMDLDPETEKAIKAIMENQRIHDFKAEDIQAQVDELAAGLMDIASIIAEGE